MENKNISHQTQYKSIDHISIFSKVLRHELKSPLNALKLNLTIIKARYQKHAKEISTALDAINYINNLLDYYKNVLDKNKGYKETFYLKDELEKIEQFLFTKLSKLDLKLVIRIPNYRLQGNRTSFKQLMLNLINNSIEAYQKVEHSKIKDIIIDGNNKINFYLIDIIDYAIGIHPKNKGKIFTPFFSCKKKQKNLGLGLNICNNILERDFNGNLELVSCKNPTIFRIRLPK